MPLFRVVFREHVAYKFYVKAPSREAVSRWAEGDVAAICGNNTPKQQVEEQGCEELEEVLVPADRVEADVVLDEDGKEK